MRTRSLFDAIIPGIAVWVGSVALIKAAEEQQLQSPSSTVEVGDEREGGSGVSVAHTKTKYATLAKKSIGEAGPYIIDSVIAVQNGGAVCSYVVVLGGLATSLFSELLEWLEVRVNSHVRVCLVFPRDQNHNAPPPESCNEIDDDLALRCSILSKGY